MLYVLPLEPMVERYTMQWYRWFKQDCASLDVPCVYIDGEQLDTTVEVGTVLDAAGTNFWKFTQLAKVCRLFKQRKIHDGDKFFSMDMWHPGLEAIPYMATLYGLDVKIYAFLHAGSYTTEDFAAPMAPWAVWFEKGWYQLCDGVFVGSNYHKEKFRELRVIGQESHVYVTGNPIRLREMPKLSTKARENIIIFSNRWDREKRPYDFVWAMEVLWETRQDFRVVITTSRPKFRSNTPSLLHVLDTVSFPYELKVGLTKLQYYEELNKAKVFVSTTIEENFGYCLVEAMAMGVFPVVRRGFSHPEIVGQMGYLFNHTTQCARLCDAALSHPFKRMGLRARVAKFDDSFRKMIRIIDES